MLKISLLGLISFMALWPAYARAEAFDESFLPFAVNIHRTPLQNWPGHGIYLGKGLFITAAHVVGHGWLSAPKIAIGGREYPTTIVKEGALEQTDITLLAVDERLLPMKLQLRHIPLCATPPRPGEDVVTVISDGVVHSRIISPDKIPPDVRKRFPTAIVDVALTGNSGSGVFRTAQRCLLGIMSRKISVIPKRVGLGKVEPVDIAKYFVPASEILDFMPAGLRLQNLVPNPSSPAFQYVP